MLQGIFVTIQGIPLALRAAGRGAPPFPPIRRDIGRLT